MDRFKNRENILIAVVLLAVFGFYFFNQKQEEPLAFTTVDTQITEGHTTEESQDILVHITGRVQKPGVYALAHDARLMDAVDAAGGLFPDADENQINLSQKLHDEARIHIPAVGESSAVQPVMGLTSGEEKIDINTASQQELESLPGVGPALAERIMTYRAQTPFTSIEDIMNVTGIGEKLFEGMKENIIVR